LTAAKVSLFTLFSFVKKERKKERRKEGKKKERKRKAKTNDNVCVPREKLEGLCM